MLLAKRGQFYAAEGLLGRCTVRNRKQFLAACGSAAAVIALPSFVRAETPSDRPDYSNASLRSPDTILFGGKT